MTDRIRTITLHQPWASLIALGVKHIETRSWAPPKGAIGQRLLIHAATMRPPRGDYGDFYVNGPCDAMYRKGTTMGAPVYDLPRGAIVASCVLADAVPIESLIHEATASRPEPWGRGTYIVNMEDQRPYGDFAPGRWAWLLEDVKPTTERCPVCWGYGWITEGQQESNCEACEGAGHCDPIPAKGLQRVWWWEP